MYILLLISSTFFWWHLTIHSGIHCFSFKPNLNRKVNYFDLINVCVEHHLQYKQFFSTSCMYTYILLFRLFHPYIIAKYSRLKHHWQYNLVVKKAASDEIVLCKNNVYNLNYGFRIKFQWRLHNSNIESRS